MKRLSALTLALVLLTAGCSTTAEDTEDSYLSTRTITMPNGKPVTCVSYKAAYAGGLSCNWEEHNK